MTIPNTNESPIVKWLILHYVNFTSIKTKENKSLQQAHNLRVLHKKTLVRIHRCVCAKLLQSCPTLCDPVDCNPPGSSVHGILQARVLEQVAIYSSKGSSQPRDSTHVSRLVHWQAGSLRLASLGKPGIICREVVLRQRRGPRIGHISSAVNLDIRHHLENVGK